MTLHVTTRGLTIPEALMAFLHAPNGRPYESVKPVPITAAAELAELLTAGSARLEGTRGDRLVVNDPVDGDRAWVREVTTELVGASIDVATWVRHRRDALSMQQAEAARRGVLTPGRRRLFGLVPYDTHTVDAAFRDQLLTHLIGPDAADDPRSAVLARLLVRSRLHLRGGIPSADRARLEELSRLAPTSTPAPSALSAVDLAMVTVIYTTVISE